MVAPPLTPQTQTASLILSLSLSLSLNPNQKLLSQTHNLKQGVSYGAFCAIVLCVQVSIAHVCVRRLEVECGCCDSVMVCVNRAIEK